MPYKSMRTKRILPQKAELCLLGILIACICLSCILIGTMVPATATEIDIETPVCFSVTVPTSLDVYMDSDGDIYTPNSAYIINRSNVDVQVTDLKLQEIGPTYYKWDIEHFDYFRPYQYKVGTRKFAAQINGEKSTYTRWDEKGISFNQENWPVIPASNGTEGTRFEFPYEAKVVPQITARQERMAAVIFCFSTTSLPKEDLDVQTYTVNFVDDEIDGAALDGKVTVTVTEGYPFVSGVFPQEPKKEGFAFAGWAYRDGEGNEVPTASPKDFRDITEDKTVYAKWWPVYTATFYDDIEGNLLDGKVTVTVKSEEANGRVVEGKFPNEPAKEGSLFDGWYYLVDGEPVAVTEPNDLQNINEDISVYAKWLSPATTYTVTFVESQGSSARYDETVTVTVAQGKVAIKGEFPDAPSREGLTFQGWYYTNEDEEVQVFVPEDFENLRKDITVYGKWGAGKVYTVIFKDAENGNLLSGTITVSVMGTNREIDGTFPAQPSKDGYKFLEWVYRKNKTEEVTVSVPEDFRNITSDLTVYAKWEDLYGEPEPTVQSLRPYNPSHTTANDLKPSFLDTGFIYGQNDDITNYRTGILLDIPTVLNTDGTLGDAAGLEFEFALRRTNPDGTNSYRILVQGEDYSIQKTSSISGTYPATADGTGAAKAFSGQQILLAPKSTRLKNLTENTNLGSLEKGNNGYQTTLYIRIKGKTSFTPVWIRPRFTCAIGVNIHSAARTVNLDIYKYQSGDDKDFASYTETAALHLAFQPSYQACYGLYWNYTYVIASSELLSGWSNAYNPDFTSSHGLLDNVVDKTKNLTFAFQLRQRACVTFTRVALQLNPWLNQDFDIVNNSYPEYYTKDKMTFCVMETPVLIPGAVRAGGWTETRGSAEWSLNEFFSLQQSANVIKEPIESLDLSKVARGSYTQTTDKTSAGWAYSIYNEDYSTNWYDIDGDGQLGNHDWNILHEFLGMQDRHYKWCKKDDKNEKTLPFGFSISAKSAEEYEMTSKHPYK